MTRKSITLESLAKYVKRYAATSDDDLYRRLVSLTIKRPMSPDEAEEWEAIQIILRARIMK